VLLLAGSLAAAAQEPAAPDGFAETIDVRAVNLEAVVTDREGRPVRGLTAADFRLLVDGREVPIDYFTEVVAGETVSAPAAGGEAGSPALPPAAPAVGRIGRSYLLFLDDSFSIAAQRNAVLKRIEKSLELLGPEDRMALVAFDGACLEKLSDWTNDGSALAAAFERARKRPARGHQVLAERRWEVDDRDLMRQALESQGSGEDVLRSGAPSLLGGGRARVTGPKHYSLLLRAVDAAAAALRGFPPPPAGRKVLLLLSGGWPEPGLLSPLIRDANRLGYTIYPVDVPGIDLMSVADMTDHRPGHVATNPWEGEAHDTLEVLARATGGRAFLNSRRLQVFQKAAEDTSSYYWLGFSPAWRADDRQHAVQLEVRRPGLTIRTRNGYADLSAETAEALRNESFLLFGGDGASSRNLWVEIGTPRRISMMIMEVPVRLAFPAALLDLEKSGDDWTAEGQLLLGALDIWGVRSDLPVIPLRHRFREAPEPDDLVRYRTTLRMRRVDQKLVLQVSAPRRGTLLWKELELGPKGDEGSRER
jgi:VWFA-related protein